MSIPSIDQISGAFNAMYQGVTYVLGFIPPVYRSISAGFQLQKIYENPNMSTTRKTASILLTGINMAAESQLVAHKINFSPNEELHKLASTAIITRAGMDLLDRFDGFGTENYANIWEMATSEVNPAIKTVKYMLKIQQIAHNREDLNTCLSTIESAEILYMHREMFLSKLKTLYRAALQASQTATNAFQIQQPAANQQAIAAQIDLQEATNNRLTNVQILYQDLLERYRETLQGRYSDFEILSLLKQEIHEELQSTKSKLRECEAIIEGKDITHFDTIPFILHGEKAFQKRMCRISGKPIRKVVTVQSDNNKAIYYEWKNLQHALENGICPPRWPASLPFGPEFTIINIEETREVINALKKASSHPKFQEKIQEKYRSYKIEAKMSEEVCKLIEADLTQTNTTKH